MDLVVERLLALLLFLPVLVAMIWGELVLSLRTRYGPAALWAGVIVAATVGAAMLVAIGGSDLGGRSVTLGRRLLVGGLVGAAFAGVVTFVSWFLQDEPEFRIRRRTLRLITVGLAAVGMLILSAIFVFFAYNW